MKKRHKIKPSLTAGALATAGLLTVGALQARAQIMIPVTNYSFETGVVGTSNPVGWTGGIVSTDYSNSVTGTNYLIVNGSATGTQFLSVGATSNYGGPVATQTTGYTASAGDLLTLTVALGPGDGFRYSQADEVGSIALTLNGMIVAENTLTTTPNPSIGSHDNPPIYFQDATATFTVPTVDAGETLGIELLSTAEAPSGQFDNVRLDVTPETVVPEPSTLSMIFAGVVSLFGSRRFRRKV